MLCPFACMQWSLLFLQLMYPAVLKFFLGTGMPSQTQPVPISIKHIQVSPHLGPTIPRDVSNACRQHGC